MKSTSKLAAAALAALLVGSSVAAHADTASAPAATETPSDQTQSAMLRTADEALLAVTRAHAARLALFDGKIDEAKANIDEAQAAFNVGEKGLNDLTIGDTEDPASKVMYLPFDMSMSLTDTFEPSAENQKAVETAAGQIKQGKTEEAIKTLKLANIDVNVSVALLPVVDTSASLENARTFIDDGKYYEANMALKKIEDSVLVRDYGIDALPVQGTPNAG